MTNTFVIPTGYTSKLDLMHTEIAINEIKGYPENEFSEALNLIKVFAPLLLREGRGINDNLNGIERIVSFDAIDINHTQIEMVQSLANWKRMALTRYGFTVVKDFIQI